MTAEPFVIVGGGLASARAISTLRTEGYDGDLVVVTAEPHLPYERPPLSKDYLRREVERSTVFPNTGEWYTQNSVDVRTASTVVGLDAAGHRLALADGGGLSYSKLLLATGSSPRSVSIPGADLLGVLSLRTLESSDLLAETLQSALRDGGGRLAVIGDGWIGMEVAASARTLGLEVTVFGHGAVPLGKVLGAEMGEVYAKLHLEHGVDIKRTTRVASIAGDKGRVTGVVLDDGTVFAADVVLVAVGAAPNVGLASSAGIVLADRSVGGGVAVNGNLQTSEPDIFAAGDIANIPAPAYGRPVRVEHWATALNTGPHVAKAMLGATDAYDTLPYFYSDQFDAGMEYTGFVAGDAGYDRVVVSGSVADREFVAFWTLDGRVQAGMGVNVWDRMPEVETLIRGKAQIPADELESFK